MSDSFFSTLLYTFLKGISVHIIPLLKTLQLFPIVLAMKSKALPWMVPALCQTHWYHRVFALVLPFFLEYSSSKSLHGWFHLVICILAQMVRVKGFEKPFFYERKPEYWLDPTPHSYYVLLHFLHCIYHLFVFFSPLECKSQDSTDQSTELDYLFQC